jgi:16S rRNA C967 or C1407 C5-methylase (RsmB/RsmF family)
MSRDAIFKGTGGQPPRGIAISMTETEYRTPSLSSALPGLAILQNLPSVLVGHLLSPRPGDCVLDMCAAPGGKTTHLAALMGNQGTLLALDRSQKRAGRVAELCAQFQLDCVRVKAGDSSKLCQSDYEFWQPDDSFDRILLDPSCSGIGTLFICNIFDY